MNFRPRVATRVRDAARSRANPPTCGGRSSAGARAQAAALHHVHTDLSADREQNARRPILASDRAAPSQAAGSLYIGRWACEIEGMAEKEAASSSSS